MASTLQPRPLDLKPLLLDPISGLHKASHLKGTGWLPRKKAQGKKSGRAGRSTSLPLPQSEYE